MMVLPLNGGDDDYGDDTDDDGDKIPLTLSLYFNLKLFFLI